MTDLEFVDGVVAAPEGQLTVGLYSYARVVDDTVYIAGHTALGPDGEVVHPGNPEAQMRYTLDGIAATLATVGATLNDIVQIRLYLTDLRDRERILAIRREYFGAPYPASTLLGVTALALEGLTVEVDGVAVIPKGD